MKKLVIFDLDGTLFDTTRAMQACGNFALAKLGYPGFAREDYARFSGVAYMEFVRAILRAAGADADRLADRFWALYLEKNAALDFDANVPYDGIPETLFALKEKGIALAVLSNKDQATCEEVVRKAFGEGVFSVIRADTGASPVKPDPAGLFDILRETGTSAADALYVGDTQVDVQTGKNAGVEAAAVLWGYRDRETLEKEAPAYLIASPAELLRFC